MKVKTQHEPPTIRGKSKSVERPYPRATLEDALKIAYAIKEKNAGNPFAAEDVASAVGLGKTAPKFFYMTAASRDFGLTEGTSGSAKISLTEMGKNLVFAPNPEAEKELKRKAFLNVEIFRKVLNHYRGSNLPEMKYLSNTLQKEFGLHPGAHEDFSKLFRENCKFLDIGEGFSPQSPSFTATLAEKSENPQSAASPVVTLAEPAKDSKLRCFVIMPFTERDNSHAKGFFNEVLQSLIVPAGREAGFTVRTANRQGSDIIQSTIMNDLLEADLVVADLTEHNPNVLFELGLRIREDKPVALIRAKGTSPIFDVDHMMRVFDYDPCLWASTIEHDAPKLTEHIMATWTNQKSASSYLKILRRQS